MERKEIETYQALVSCFSEFLLVAVHTILAERDVYPRNSFLRARKWGNAVFQSRHPAVTEWINDAVTAVEKQLLKGTVRQVSLVIFSSSSVPLERFVFNTSRFPIVSEADLLTPFVAPSGGSGPECVSAGKSSDGTIKLPEPAVVDLNAQFRGLMNRICQLSKKLGSLPPECTYTIAIENRDKPQGRAPIERLSAFIPAESQLPNPSASSTRTTPLRSVDSGAFIMETWIEESQAKLDAAAVMTREDVDAAREDANDLPDKPFDPLLEAMDGKTYVK